MKLVKWLVSSVIVILIFILPGCNIIRNIDYLMISEEDLVGTWTSIDGEDLYMMFGDEMFAIRIWGRDGESESFFWRLQLPYLIKEFWEGESSLGFYEEQWLSVEDSGVLVISKPDVDMTIALQRR